MAGRLYAAGRRGVKQARGARMAEVRAFSGWRYAPGAGTAAELICPPYDIIGPEQARQLRDRSPVNAVYLELPEGSEDPAAPDSRYRRAASTLADWKNRDILR